MKYARIVNGVVSETFVPPDGFSLRDCFEPGHASEFEEAPESVQAGWVYSKGEYSPPVPEPEPETREPSVPSSVTIRQAKLQMSRAGILSDVDAAIAAMEGQAGEEARIDWQYATELRRDHPLVEALGPTLSLTDEAIDALFVEAAKIA